ncbi:hypothetical protein, partial [Brucella rhizosphaerae]|uniref:hypothetical protein n=1 Tax=Brucella rhizosphaerae TaxID=571254 RepID=UPI001AEBF6E2
MRWHYPKVGNANLLLSGKYRMHFTGGGTLAGCSPSSACKPLGFLFYLEAVTLSTDLTEGNMFLFDVIEHEKAV